MMFLRHFAITISVICSLYAAYINHWKTAFIFVIALLVNGIYLIDERIKELKKNEGGK